MINANNIGRVHIESGSVPDSSEPYTSGRLRVGFAYTLLTTDPTRTVRVRYAYGTRTVRRVHTATAMRPVVTRLHVLNSVLPRFSKGQGAI